MSPSANTHEYVLVAFCTVVAAVIRWMVGARSGLWGDECLFLFISGLPTAGDIFRFLHFNESHPPLYYLFMHVWMRWFGRADLTVLLPSVLVGSLLVPQTYWVGRRIFGGQVGLLAAALVSISPVLVYTSSEVRPYALLNVLALAASYYVWRMTQAPQTETIRATVAAWRADGLPFLLIAVLLLYTHNWTVLFLFGLTVGYLLHALTERRGVARMGQQVGRLAASYAGAALLYLPWVPVAWYQVRFAGHSEVPATSFSWFVTTQWHRFHGLGWNGKRAFIVSCLFALFCIALLLLDRRVKSAPQQTATLAGGKQVRASYWLFLGTPAVCFPIAFVLSSQTALFWARCLSLTMPSILLAVACAGAAALRGFSLPDSKFTRLLIGQNMGGKGRHVVVVGVLAWLAMHHATGNDLNFTMRKSATREQARYVQDHWRSDDLVLIAPHYVASAWNWYFPPQGKEIPYPFARRTVPVTFSNLADRYRNTTTFRQLLQSITQARKQGRRVWYLSSQPVPGTVATLVQGDISFVSRDNKWGKLVAHRNNQIITFMKQTYGTPEDPDIPGEDMAASEIYLYLFTPAENLPLNLKASSTKQ